MAWRDSRASRRRLVLFSFSVVLGIAALVAVGSFSANLARAIGTQAKGLLGADLVVISRAVPSAAVQSYLDGLGGEQSKETGFSSMLVFPTANGATRLVQVRAEQGRFPFYGDFLTAPVSASADFQAVTTATDGAAAHVILLEETLLQQFGVNVGDDPPARAAGYGPAGEAHHHPTPHHDQTAGGHERGCDHARHADAFRGRAAVV